ncbi:RNA-directed DNA polymerase, eukaryota, reverse transcriptase zinc-binding domain protein [Tanacetum coccineum]
MKKKLGNGLSTLFWDDVWCDGGKLKNRFPRAYALENSKQITVGQKLAHPSLYHSFRRHPRGGLELTQVEELAKVINPVVLTQSPDSWSWTLNNSGGYTVASSRNMIDSRLLPKGDLKTRWIRYVPNKVNTFAWKVMTNSLPTRFNISRRGIDIESLSCVNCDVGIETNDHLFFACNTAKKISKLINRWWDVPFMDINSYGEWRSWIDNVKLPKKNKSMFQVLITGVGIDAILCLAGTIAMAGQMITFAAMAGQMITFAAMAEFGGVTQADTIVKLTKALHELRCDSQQINTGTIWSHEQVEDKYSKQKIPAYLKQSNDPNSQMHVQEVLVAKLLMDSYMAQGHASTGSLRVAEALTSPEQKFLYQLQLGNIGTSYGIAFYAGSTVIPKVQEQCLKLEVQPKQIPCANKCMMDVLELW